MPSDSRRLTPDWAAQAAESPEAGLKRFIQAHDVWLETLHDPDMGDVGKKFRKAIRAFGYPEISQNEPLPLAHLNIGFFLKGKNDSFEYFHQPKIIFGNSASNDADLFYMCRTHEYIHALQCIKAPVTLTGSHLPFCLCPEDTLRAQELMERDAYTKEMWLMLLPYQDGSPASTLVNERYSYGRAAFTSHREILGLQKALIMNAYALDNISLRDRRPGKSSDAINFVADCHATALANTELYLSTARQHDLKTTYVRCEPDDLYLIGGSFGPNSLGMDSLDDKYRQPLALTDEHRRHVADLNAQMNIRDRNELPTFKEALAARGLTPEGYLRLLHAKRPYTDKAPSRHAQAQPLKCV